MSSHSPPPGALHARRSARQLDTALAAAAIAAWLSFFVWRGHTFGWLVTAAAGALSAMAIFRPWCRSLARRSIDAATWSVEREREHAAANAEQHAATWRAIVATANEGIVTIDADGIVETVNGATERMFGYTAKELIGKNVNAMMPEPFCSEHDGYIHHYRATGEKRIIGIGREVLAKRKDGSVFPIDLSVGEGKVGERQFFSAVIRDLTEQKELQGKLAQSERLAAVGELAAGVAHEINNPVNTIINCAQLVVDGDEPDENLQIVIEEGGRITEIVQALLQFARDDNDSAQPTSLTEVIDRTKRLIGESWTRHGIKLSIAATDDMPNVNARPQRVQQVLLNLLINAKDALMLHNVQNRAVYLTAEQRDDGVQFIVRDNGPGIDKTVIDRIFDPFVTTKRARGGTGLGLSVSRSIIEGYQGRITAENLNEGGARFTVWLPLAQDE